MPDRSYYQRVSDIVDETGRLPGAPQHKRFGKFWRGLKRALLWTVPVLCLLVAVAYAGDYLLIRYRIHAARNPFGTVQVDRFYAIPQKGSRTEFDYAGTDTQTCIHTLFPQLGYTPCWYASRHTSKQINF